MTVTSDRELGFGSGEGAFSVVGAPSRRWRRAAAEDLLALVLNVVHSQIHVKDAIIGAKLRAMGTFVFGFTPVFTGRFPALDHQEWSLQLHFTRHGKTHQVSTQYGLTG